MLGLSTSQCSFMTGSNRPSLRRTAAAPVVKRGSVSVHAKLSQAKDFRNMSQEEIMAEVDTAKGALFDLRFKQKHREEMKTSDFGKLKLKVAQLLTVSREMEIAAGETDRRAWRRKQKQKNIDAGFSQF